MSYYDVRIKRAGQVTDCFHLWPGLPWAAECATDHWGCWWTGRQCITWPLVSPAGQQTDVSVGRLGIDRLTSGGRRAPGQRVLSNITAINDINDHWKNMWCIYDPTPRCPVKVGPFPLQSIVFVSTAENTRGSFALWLSVAAFTLLQIAPPK